MWGFSPPSRSFPAPISKGCCGNFSDTSGIENPAHLILKGAEFARGNFSDTFKIERRAPLILKGIGNSFLTVRTLRGFETLCPTSRAQGGAAAVQRPARKFGRPQALGATFLQSALQLSKPEVASPRTFLGLASSRRED